MEILTQYIDYSSLCHRQLRKSGFLSSTIKCGSIVWFLHFQLCRLVLNMVHGVLESGFSHQLDAFGSHEQWRDVHVSPDDMHGGRRAETNEVASHGRRLVLIKHERSPFGFIIKMLIGTS